MNFNTLIQASVWVTGLSCFAALSISVPARQPLRGVYTEYNEYTQGDNGGADNGD